MKKSYTIDQGQINRIAICKGFWVALLYTQVFDGAMLPNILKRYRYFRVDYIFYHFTALNKLKGNLKIYHE